MKRSKPPLGKRAWAPLPCTVERAWRATITAVMFRVECMGPWTAKAYTRGIADGVVTVFRPEGDALGEQHPRFGYDLAPHERARSGPRVRLRLRILRAVVIAVREAHAAFLAREQESHGIALG